MKKLKLNTQLKNCIKNENLKAKVLLKFVNDKLKLNLSENEINTKSLESLGFTSVSIDGNFLYYAK